MASIVPPSWTASAKDKLDTKIDQDCCYVWSNKSSAPATVMVKLQR